MNHQPVVTNLEPSAGRDTEGCYFTFPARREIKNSVVAAVAAGKSCKPTAAAVPLKTGAVSRSPCCEIPANKRDKS